MMYPDPEAGSLANFMSLVWWRWWSSVSRLDYQRTPGKFPQLLATPISWPLWTPTSSRCSLPRVRFWFCFWSTIYRTKEQWTPWWSISTTDTTTTIPIMSWRWNSTTSRCQRIQNQMNNKIIWMGEDRFLSVRLLEVYCWSGDKWQPMWSFSANDITHGHGHGHGQKHGQNLAYFSTSCVVYDGLGNSGAGSSRVISVTGILRQGLYRFPTAIARAVRGRFDSAIA